MDIADHAAGLLDTRPGWRIVPCPGCARGTGTARMTVRFDPPLRGTGRLVECPACRLVWLNPQPSEDALVDTYPADEYYAYHYVETVCQGRGWYSRSTDQLRRWAIEVSIPARLRRRPWWARAALRVLTIPARQRFHGIPAQDSGRLLDLGCGDGAFGVYMKEVGWSVCGVEFHPAGAARARANGLEVYQGSFLRDELPWHSFDVVRLWHVLEHVSDPRQALARAISLLKPGGELIVGVPNFSSPYQWLFGPRWAAIQAPQHLLHFTEPTLRKMTDDAGFIDVRVWHASVGTGMSSLAAMCPKSWGPIVFNPASRAASILSDLVLDTFHFGDGLELRARRPG